MFNPLTGLYSTVFDGRNDYPDVTSFIVQQGIVAGQAYRFIVRAA